MIESYKERFGKPYKRKLIKDDKLNRVDIYDAMAHITKPENVTSFRSAFESLLDYMIKDDWQNDKRYFDPFFQEWWEKEILAIFNFDAHFVEMRQQRQKEYEDAKNGLEAMCEIDAPEESNRQVLVDYIASQMDGHTIFKVSYLEELNCDERVIKYLATRHWSDFRDHKSTFYSDNANLIPFRLLTEYTEQGILILSVITLKSNTNLRWVVAQTHIVKCQQSIIISIQKQLDEDCRNANG